MFSQIFIKTINVKINGLFGPFSLETGPIYRLLFTILIVKE